MPLPSLSVLKVIDQISDSIGWYSSAELFELSAIVGYQDLVFCITIAVGCFPLPFDKGRT